MPKDGKPRANGGAYVPMTMSGFCQFPSPSSHSFCRRVGCTCYCHNEHKEEDS